MIDFFDFDEEYAIRKQLSVKNFLAGSNLNTEERNYLKKAIVSINLMYDLVDLVKDELIILNIELENIIKNNINIHYIATVIARAIPHSVVVILSIGDNAKLYAFNARQNKLDSSRNVVENQISSNWFTASNPEHYMKKVLDEFQNTKLPVASVEETVFYWMSLIRESREIISEDIYRSNVRWEQKKAERYKLLHDNDLPSVEEVLSEELNYYETEYQKNFIHTLAEYSVIFYNEFRDSFDWIVEDVFDEYLIENEKDEWINDYLDICELIVEDELIREILDVEIKTILETFYNNEKIELDGNEVIDEFYLQDKFSYLRSLF